MPTTRATMRQRALRSIPPMPAPVVRKARAEM
jgi:hypothetical protein